MGCARDRSKVRARIAGVPAAIQSLVRLRSLSSTVEPNVSVELDPLLFCLLSLFFAQVVLATYRQTSCKVASRAYMRAPFLNRIGGVTSLKERKKSRATHADKRGGSNG